MSDDAEFGYYLDCSFPSSIEDLKERLERMMAEFEVAESRDRRRALRQLPSADHSSSTRGGKPRRAPDC
jgi:predicted nucleotidyltransferase component of viral defense system